MMSCFQKQLCYEMTSVIKKNCNILSMASARRESHIDPGHHRVLGVAVEKLSDTECAFLSRCPAKAGGGGGGQFKNL